MNDEEYQRNLEEIQYYSSGYWAFMKRMMEPDMQHPYDQDRGMETINYNYNCFLLFSLEPQRSFCLGVLNAQKFFENTKIIPG